MRRTTRKRALLAALAASLVATTPAFGMPIDRVDRYQVGSSSLAGTPAADAAQDLRSPDARDAALPPVEPQGNTQDLRSPDARDAALPPVRAQKVQPGQPTWPSYPAPIAKSQPPAQQLPSGDGGDDTWFVVGIGLAGAALAAAGAAGIARRSRIRARRVAV